jgi:hypothetical protein
MSIKHPLSSRPESDLPYSANWACSLPSFEFKNLFLQRSELYNQQLSSSRDNSTYRLRNKKKEPYLSTIQEIRKYATTNGGAT